MSHEITKNGRFTASTHSEGRRRPRYRTLFPLSSNDPFQDVFNQFGDEQEQRVAKATAEMLQRLESDEVIAPAEKEFERAQEIESAFDKDFDGLDGA